MAAVIVASPAKAESHWVSGRLLAMMYRTAFVAIGNHLEEIVGLFAAEQQVSRFHR